MKVKKEIKVGDVYKDGYGKNVRIVCIDLKWHYPVIGAIEDSKNSTVNTYTKEGLLCLGTKSNGDLIIPYEVDWTKVPVDAKVLVKDHESDEFKKRYFAKYENERVYTFTDGATSWSVESDTHVFWWQIAELAE